MPVECNTSLVFSLHPLQPCSHWWDLKHKTRIERTSSGPGALFPENSLNCWEEPGTGEEREEWVKTRKQQLLLVHTPYSCCLLRAFRDTFWFEEQRGKERKKKEMKYWRFTPIRGLKKKWAEGKMLLGKRARERNVATRGQKLCSFPLLEKEGERVKMKLENDVIVRGGSLPRVFC